MGITEELRWAAAKLVNVGKFAVDSAVNESLIKGKLKAQPPSDNSNGDKAAQNRVTAQEMQAKLEKMQDETNNIQQQIKISALRTEEKEYPKQFFDDEPLKSSFPQITGRKRIFIRV